MTPEELVSLLITISGTLILTIVGMFSWWIKGRFDNHEKRIELLEEAKEDEAEDRQEMLGILRGLRRVG